MALRFLIVGAGFSGSVLANNLISKINCTIDLWDERDHVGGNCYTERDEETGIMIHKFGPHIFNTDKKEIWDYVNVFGKFKPYIHRAKANVNGKIYSLPVNLHTINQFFGKSFSPDAAKLFIENISDKSIDEPKNFEEQALKFIGKDLYYAFFYGYTKKQWGCDPKELPASILKRLPVRFNYNDNYYHNIFTGIPVDGYTALCKKMIDFPGIHLMLNKRFHSFTDVSDYDHIFYTGSLDAYFNFKYGRLGYRTVSFESSMANGDFQGTSIINYCDEEVPYTRITEHKHFTPWEKHNKTIFVKEYSKETAPSDIPFYPKRLLVDKKLLKKYREEAKELNKISFLGRLATYRYLDMQHVIEEALAFSKSFIDAANNNLKPSAFPNQENY